MSTQLEDLAFKLSNYNSATGVNFDALLNAEGDVLTIYCSDTPETPIILTAPDGQILTVTPLFDTSDIKEDMAAELHIAMLSIGPVMPLSSIGKQGNSYFVYGSMAHGTVFENIVHELQLQVNNTLDTIDALNDYLV